ncbi:MAG: pyruvate kinase [Spirochaetes bacterium]|nr:MAG: pyruvate kinase [Spirochaetota bacterium]
MKATKIVCTIGPSSQNEEVLRKMVDAGMNVARLNMSHGSYEFHQKTIRNVRSISKKTGKHIGILLDLQGPKIRTGKQIKETIELKKGELLKLTTEDITGNWEMLSINYKQLPDEAKPGEKILLDDGNIELKILEIENRVITCRILNGGTIRSFRGINLPDTAISTPSLTEKDIQDLAFGLDNDVDFVALSFVRKAEDITDLKSRINKAGKDIFVVAKIEKPEAIENIDAIIAVTDGIMVARGDLGAETSPQEVPILQKSIIRKCNYANKPVITATQMLESMISKPRPTRAEANDVANAIFDGTDAVMLSGETAMGEYPVEAVTIMSHIAQRTEREVNNHNLAHEIYSHKEGTETTAEAVCYAGCELCRSIKSTYIAGFSLSGATIQRISGYRPPKPILGMSPSDKILQRASLFWGVRAVKIDHVESTDALLKHTNNILTKTGLCTPGDRIVTISGSPLHRGVSTNMIKVHIVQD